MQTGSELRRAFELHRAGKLAEAEAAYRSILAAEPDQPDAACLLAGLFIQSGRSAEALPHLDHVLTKHPAHTTALARRALALHEAGQRGDARLAYERAIAAGATEADLFFNYANLLSELGQLEAAAAAYERLLQLDANAAAAWINLGLVRRSLGEPEAALACFLEAAQRDPDAAHAWHNAGALLREMGRPAEAIEPLRKGASLAPESVDTISTLVKTLLELGQVAEAETRAGSLLERHPESSLAWATAAHVDFAAGRIDAAAKRYERAAELEPNRAEHWTNLGASLKELGQLSESELAIERALELEHANEAALTTMGAIALERDDVVTFANACRRIRPRSAEHWLWELRAQTACPTVFPSAPALDDYRQHLSETLERFVQDRPVAAPEAIFAAQCFPSFNWPFHGRDDRPIKESFARILEPSFRPKELARRTGPYRAGIVITDGHEMPFLRSMAAVFSQWTTGAFEATVICSAAGERRIRPQLPGSVQYLVLPTDVKSLWKQMAEANFDLLYFREIGTDAVNYLLPFGRLAPVQCNTYGIQVTSGNRAVDYYLSSDLVEIPGAGAHYTERLVRMETLLVCRAPLPRPDRPREREHFGLPTAARIYLCPQQLGKFQPDFDAVIAAILERDPQGLVVITAGRVPEVRLRLAERFSRTIPHADRIRFVPQQQGEDYASLLLAADVLLDPFHFGGMNTSYDPLALGKVVVTLPSEYHRGRYTLGCYRAMGLDAAVANTPADYIDRAVRIAGDPDYRRELEEQIRRRGSVLFHDARVARELEEFFLHAIAKSRQEN